MNSSDARSEKVRRIGLQILPVAVVLLGFVLRSAYIGHESAGHDEAFSIWAVGLPFRQMLGVLIEDFVHPPLHYLALRAWLNLFGFSLIAARMLSACYSTLAIAVLYLLAKYVLGRRVALIAALLLAISQLSIWFAQEPRPYAQLELLTLLSSYFAVRALREGRNLYWWGFVVASLATVYTHYWGTFTIGTLLLYIFLYRKDYSIRRLPLLVGFAMALVIYVPWIASVYSVAIHAPKLFSGKLAYWAIRPSSPVSAVNAFDNGKPDGFWVTPPLWAVAVGFFLFCVPAITAAARRIRPTRPANNSEQLESQGLILASMTWILPFLAVMGMGVFGFQYNVRYVEFTAAPYYMLVAWGLSKVSGNLFPYLILAILLYSGHALKANYVLRAKEDLSSAAAYLEMNRDVLDCGVFLPFSQQPLEWGIATGGRSLFRLIDQSQIPEAHKTCARVWTVSVASQDSPSMNRNADRKASPLEQHYAPRPEQRYYGVRVRLYDRKRE